MVLDLVPNKVFFDNSYVFVNFRIELMENVFVMFSDHFSTLDNEIYNLQGFSNLIHKKRTLSVLLALFGHFGHIKLRRKCGFAYLVI